MKQNIAIVMGGFSSEHDISVKSGHVVKKYLNDQQYNTYLIHITKTEWTYTDDNDNKWPVNKADFSLNINNRHITFDCVFNAIHGTPGEDGLLQSYFELVNVKHTSCPPIKQP